MASGNVFVFASFVEPFTMMPDAAFLLTKPPNHCWDTKRRFVLVKIKTKQITFVALNEVLAN